MALAGYISTRGSLRWSNSRFTVRGIIDPSSFNRVAILSSSHRNKD
jgi:hypothetical protein